ncbi:Uncharacterised protein [uncultured archaeon]|nr:Uncharacterised protein [uncultured archaeon]
MTSDKKLFYFLNKYLVKIKPLYNPDEFPRKKDQISIVSEALKKEIRII